jgi:hypothetical protein
MIIFECYYHIIKLNIKANYINQKHFNNEATISHNLQITSPKIFMNPSKHSSNFPVIKQQHSPNYSPNTMQHEPITPVHFPIRAPESLQNFRQFSAKYVPKAAKFMHEQQILSNDIQHSLTPYFSDIQHRAKYNLFSYTHA